MANFSYKTKGNTDPKGKPRVYFTCHPADFERYFEKILTDIFKTHDCAVYYTEDMAQPMDEAELEVGLGQMNLFVVPVTFRLLSQPNRAMDGDIAYAKQENIPILPFMMEAGIDEIYSKPDKFGQRQYLNPCSTDLTEISYESKLKKYLDSVLVSDEMAKRVRAAFDAYIFLSYRKKDRKYANELMKLIHKNRELRDIAIWYDEFLTPGESFVDSIQKALADSKLFALLVTPNLLEEPDGKPNFVMAEEYPAAVKAGKEILPAEMVPTDHGALTDKFPNIPDCADPQNDTAFRECLLQSLQKVAVTANDHDPEHNFLIGLAYLEGIDVEVNRERGIELLTKAAEAGLPEAMDKLYGFYWTTYNDKMALFWAERAANYYIGRYGQSHPETLAVLKNLASAYGRMENHQKETDLWEKVYLLQMESLGEEHPDTLQTLSELALRYRGMGASGLALKLLKSLYPTQQKVLGEKHNAVLATMHRLVFSYDDIGMPEKALEMLEELYRLSCQVYGQQHPNVMNIMHTKAQIYDHMGKTKQAIELMEQVYDLQCQALGEEHPDTWITLNNLASIHCFREEYKLARALFEKIYVAQCRMLGKKHLNTQQTMNNLAFTLYYLGEYKTALELYEQVYQMRYETLGAEHRLTMEALENLKVVKDQLG